MEGRGREESAELSSANPTKPAGTLMLRNFTIPRKKRVSGQVLLEPCPEESRDYSLIQSKLKESRLDMRKENDTVWRWRDVKLVHNEEFLKEFSEKRSEMRKKGRRGREMEERFCFLVEACEETTQIYQLGLRTESQDQYSLGKPSHGVYLFRHVDVALKHAATSTFNGKNLIIFKVLFGKVKKLTPSSDRNKTPDPTIAFDCHMSKDGVSNRDSLSQQVIGSSVFLFDYKENQELNKRPRQCLPYAVVEFVPAASAIPLPSISPPLSHNKHPAGVLHGPPERLKGCTVAKRRGKGENATVTFKHFATQSCPGLDYRSPNSGADITQHNDLQTPFPFIPQQLYMPLLYTAGYFSPSLPNFDNGIPSQNCLEEITLPSNVQHSNTTSISENNMNACGVVPESVHVQHSNTTSISENNMNACGVVPESPAEKIPTIVYSSRLVKDPRLTRQETSIQKPSSEKERASSVVDCNEQRWQPQNQEKNNEMTRPLSCKTQVDNTERKDDHLKPSAECTHAHQPNPHQKTENMPSIKLFKMKFQKYAAYFKMTEEERQKHIWSQENLTLEQKQSLIDRVHFYEMYYQRYKQGMLFQRENETDNGTGPSQIGHKNKEICLSTEQKSSLLTRESACEVNKAHLRHSVSAVVSISTSVTDLANTERNKADTFCKDSNEVRHNNTETTTQSSTDIKEDPRSDSLEYCVESQCVVQFVGEHCVSEKSLEQGLSQQSLSEKSKVVEVTCDKEQPLRPSSPSTRAVSTNEISTNACDATLNSNLEEGNGFHFHNLTAMDFSKSVEITLLDESKRTGVSLAMTAGKEENSLSTENQNVESLSHSDDRSEMSVEFKMGESPQDNSVRNALFSRFQLDQLLLNLNGTNLLIPKSYLRPKCLDKTISMVQTYHCLNQTTQKEDHKADVQNWEYGKNPQLIVVKKSDQPPATERPTLSERFSKLRLPKQKLTAKEKTSTNRYGVYPSGDVKSDTEAITSSSDSQVKVLEIDNVKLIQLLAQRYNAKRSLKKCKHIQGKCSKKKSKSTGWSLKHSFRPLSHILRRSQHIRSRYLSKAKRKCKTKPALKWNSKGQALGVAKLTSNLSDSISCTTEMADHLDSCINLDGTSQPSDPQSCDQLTTDESIHKDKATNISTKDHSCPNTSIIEKGESHEIMHIPHCNEQGTNTAKLLPEMVCDDVSRISTNCEIKEPEEEGALPAFTNGIYPERGTTSNSSCHQENSLSITCSANNKSNIEEVIVKPELEQEARSKQVREDKCGTKDLSIDSNNGNYKDNSHPVQVVSSILSDITTGNMISGKAEMDTTPNLPRVMNNDERVMEKEAEILHERKVDDADSGVTKHAVSDTGNASRDVNGKEMGVNLNIQNSVLYSEPKRTDVNDKEFLPREEKSDAYQGDKKTRDDVMVDASTNPPVDTILSHGSLNTPAEPMINTQCQPAVENSETTKIINSELESTENMASKVSKEADIVDIKGGPLSAWQGHVKNSITNPTETQLITKLRDYLNRFEFTVKRQESVSDSGKNNQVPMAWITLDSTIHKQQLLDSRHNSRIDLANLQHQSSDFGPNKSLNYMTLPTKNEKVPGKAGIQTETADSPVDSNKSQVRGGERQPKSSASKRTRRSKVERLSPDSTSVLETMKKPSHPNDLHLLENKDTGPLQLSSSVPNVHQWPNLVPNPVNTAQQNKISSAQGSENLNGLSEHQSQVNQLMSQKPEKITEQILYNEKVNTYVQRVYSVTDISSTLKLADHALSLGELMPLHFTCKSMLQYFISNFERDQRVSFNQSCISRNLIVEKYLDHPPAQVEMKFEALNSFLELQMMMEAWQFVENKINFLRRKPTFRSLLWYDPTLYGEIYKGAVGFQQQSSLFSSFQHCLASEGYCKVQEYYVAVSTLHQQLQDSPDTSYYMYLKSKRERLEVEAALRNPSDVKSFFLSVPIALMVNFGDTLEALEKAHRLVMTFVETPSDRLPGTFDVGKAEHLSIICRYLQEKVNFFKASEDITKVSWFGLEHLLYDAYKVLMWTESEQGASNEVLKKYKRPSSQIVYGVTEGGVVLINKREPTPHSVEKVQIPSQKKTEADKKRKNVQCTEREHKALNIPNENAIEETYRPAKRRATYPSVRQNDGGGASPFIQSNPATQHGNQSLYSSAFTQKSNTVWRKPEKQSWEWKQPAASRPSTSHSELRALLLSKRRATIACTEQRNVSVTEYQNRHAVNQGNWPPPLIVNPRAAERINHQPMIGAPHHAELPKPQASDSTVPLIQPFPFSGYPANAPSVVAPALPPLPFPNTSDQVLTLKPTPLNYPYFVFNGQTYSTTGSSVPVSAIHNETRYHPHPV